MKKSDTIDPHTYLFICISLTSYNDNSPSCVGFYTRIVESRHENRLGLCFGIIFYEVNTKNVWKDKTITYKDKNP